MESIQARGVWWLPASPDKRVAGTLEFHPDKGIELSLIGSFSGSTASFEPTTHELIHGIVEPNSFGRLITLQRCFQTRFTFGFPGFMTETLLATVAFGGNRHLVDETDFLFKSATVRMVWLDDWVTNSGIRNLKRDGLPDGAHFGISYTPWPPLQSDVGSARIRLFPQFGATHQHHAVDFKENIALEVELFHPSGFDNLSRDYLWPLQALLSLACDRTTPVKELRLRGQNGDEEVNTLYQPVFRHRDREPTRLNPHDCLVPFSDVANGFPSMICRWLDFCNSARATVELFFASEYGRPNYVETFFSTMFQSAVLLAHFRKRFRHPPSQCLAKPEATSQAIAGMMAEFDVPMSGLVEDREAFATDVVKTFVACFERTAVPPPTTLSRKASILALLLKLSLLSELGFTPTEIASLAAKNNGYRNLQSAA